MDWVWPLYERYVLRRLSRNGVAAPTETEKEEAFFDVLRRSTVTVLVQEPWQGSVRFKCLARYDVSNMFDLLGRPDEFLLESFGGGKFKLNFHDGWNFVATRNFKPRGEPLWKDLPELEIETTT